MSEDKATGNEAGNILLEALGIDPKNVTGIDISAHAGEMAVVTVTRFVGRGQVGAFGQKYKERFELVRRGPQEAIE